MFRAYIVSVLMIPRDSRAPLLAAAVTASGREENRKNGQMWKSKTAEEPSFLDAGAVLVSLLRA